MKKYSLEDISKMSDVERIKFAKEVNSLSVLEKKDYLSNYTYRDKLVVAKYLLDAIKYEMGEEYFDVSHKIDDLKNREFFTRFDDDYFAKLN